MRLHLSRRAYLLIFAIVFLYMAINVGLAWTWLNRPFSGFLHQNRVVSYMGLPHWENRQPRIGSDALKRGDVIQQVNEQTITSSAALIKESRLLPIGQSLAYQSEGSWRPVFLAVTRFTNQDFTQLVMIPAFVSFILLLIAGTTVFLKPELPAVMLFVLFIMAQVIYLTSFPEFMSHPFWWLHWVLAYLGKIVIPLFLLHLLLLIPSPRHSLLKHPLVAIMLYFPLVPALIHLPILLGQPETTLTFERLINSYSILYGLLGVSFLTETIFRAARLKLRQQAGILLCGLLGPAVLLILLSLTNVMSNADISLVYTILEKYGFVGLPVAVAITVIRYELFDIKRTRQNHFLYLRVIILALLGYLFFIIMISPFATSLTQLGWRDGVTIILTVVAYYVALRPLYYQVRDYMTQRQYGSIEDLRAGYRILSAALVEVKSKRDLERLISWELPSDFRLRSAELVPSDRPRSPFAYQLPLAVNNVFLGTLFLGSKINGENFTGSRDRNFARGSKAAFSRPMESGTG